MKTVQALETCGKSVTNLFVKIFGAQKQAKAYEYMPGHTITAKEVIRSGIHGQRGDCVAENGKVTEYPLTSARILDGAFGAMSTSRAAERVDGYGPAVVIGSPGIANSRSQQSPAFSRS
jgi:hypothetical protein